MFLVSSTDCAFRPIVARRRPAGELGQVVHVTSESGPAISGELLGARFSLYPLFFR